MMLVDLPFQLKDGREAVICGVTDTDASTLLDFVRQTAGETPFLSRVPEDCEDMTLESELEWIHKAQSNPDVLYVFCRVGGILVASAEIKYTNRVRTKHRATVGIAILKDYWGLGIGTRMFELLLRNAKQRPGVTHVELSRYEGNVRARALYEKFGFRAVCIIPDAWRRDDGTLGNEIRMVKHL